MTKKNTPENATIQEKLDRLHHLQQIDSKIDKIRTMRGELPLEVEDLEDEIQGLETRLEKIQQENAQLEQTVSNLKNTIKDAKAAIKKYTEQQKSVRNNREFDSISKEIEFQELEIQLSEKKMKEANFAIESKVQSRDEAEEKVDLRKKDLAAKKADLQEILDETEKEEQALAKESEEVKGFIESRLVKAYDRLRNNYKNGLAVVSIVRDSCGGCFNKIPPQRQIDIRARKKIIVCEHCGRILVAPPVTVDAAEQ